jgi:hypothetical protein
VTRDNNLVSNTNYIRVRVEDVDADADEKVLRVQIIQYNNDGQWVGEFERLFWRLDPSEVDFDLAVTSINDGPLLMWDPPSS